MEEEDEDEEDFLEGPSASQCGINQSSINEDSNNQDDLEVQNEEDEEVAKSKSTKKMKKKNKKTMSAVEVISEDEKPVENTEGEAKDESGDEFEKTAPANKPKRRRNKLTSTKPSSDLISENGNVDNIEVLDDKSSKNAARNEKKIKGKEIRQDPTIPSVSSTSLKCVACAASFPSKNKLFDHLKATKHATYIEKPNIESEEGSRKKKGKKK